MRRAGDDVQPGDVAVRAGAVIGAAQVGLLAAVGRERVLVHPRPTAASSPTWAAPITAPARTATSPGWTSRCAPER
ncbi:hypothetical protein MAHJHV28_47190 [Mycobacterium avium subsp. hominissuis]